ncbi:MAG TPA: ATP-dependent DNA helicase RecG [Candidatus Saccharimonadales bacterium]|nr:ATP-dependent DNA helicase RecG [Candidatus Saccharimonadales bacterium]
MNLSDELVSLKGIGPALSQKFLKIGLVNVDDLVNYFPRRYSDFSNVVEIASTKPGDITVVGKIHQVTGRYSRRGLHITEAIVSDKTGSLRLIWFNQHYRKDSISSNKEYFVSGDFGLHGKSMSLINPAVELVSNFPVSTARILSIYRETKGLNSNQIRQAIKAALPYFEQIEEILPDWIISRYDLMPRAEAHRQIHFPKDQKTLEKARFRLGFEEVFELCLSSLLAKAEIKKQVAVPFKFDETIAKKFVNQLPFKLTDEQKRVVWQIYQDIGKSTPMNRLVEGDVGTGKTVVSSMAALMVLHSGYSVAFMAPTELLARQHANTIANLLKNLDMDKYVSLLLGSLNPKQKILALEHLKSTDMSIVIGTHALIQEGVDITKLGLVIIDEQHRFGVKQRQALLKKIGYMPHLLSMSATPIPRSLQLVVFGELDVSRIKHKPYESKQINTQIYKQNKRLKMYQLVAKELDQGNQAFIVCPHISRDSQIKLASAEAIYEELTKGPLKSYRIGLLHGKQKKDEQDKVMQDFVDHHLDAIVSTTIVEVGVDVPNASVMVIEAAERFGLAQIHQLRGRVGRSDIQGHCFLVIADDNQPSPRIRALEQSSDGFRLAELDLKLRGPGAIYGTAQHGILDLRIAQLDDEDLIYSAKQAATEFIDKDNLLQYDQLSKRVAQIRSVTNLN